MNMTPPFTLADLEASLGRRLRMPANEIQSIANQIYERYQSHAPSDTPWRTRQVTFLEKDRPGQGYVGYDLCRADWVGGVYFSSNETLVQALAEALNELEGRLQGRGK
jgi:hypothetical protein